MAIWMSTCTNQRRKAVDRDPRDMVSEVTHSAECGDHTESEDAALGEADVLTDFTPAVFGDQPSDRGRNH